MVDNSYESIVQNTYEDPLISDTFLKISLLDRLISSFFMAYILILIFHLIKNISLIFSQKLSAAMSQHIIVMDPNHRDMAKENRKD